MSDLSSPAVRRDDSRPAPDRDPALPAGAQPGAPGAIPSPHLENLENNDPLVERALLRGVLIDRATRDQAPVDPSQIDAVLERVSEMGGAFHALQPGARRAIIRQSLGGGAPQDVRDIERFVEAAEAVLVEREDAKRQAIMNRPENVEAGREALERGLLQDAGDAGKKIGELRARLPGSREELLAAERDWGELLSRIKSEETAGRLGADRAARLIEKAEKTKGDSEASAIRVIRERDRTRERLEELTAAAKQSGIDRERARQSGSAEAISANDRAFAELLEKNRALLDGSPGSRERMSGERTTAEESLRALNERATRAAAGVKAALSASPPDMEAFASALGKGPVTTSVPGSHAALIAEIDFVLAKSGEGPLSALVEGALSRKPLESRMASRLLEGDFVGYEALCLKAILDRGEPSSRESVIGARADFREWASRRSTADLLRVLSRHRADANETGGEITACIEKSLGRHTATWARAYLNDMRTSHRGAMEASIFRERVDDGESFAVVAAEGYRRMTSAPRSENKAWFTLIDEYKRHYEERPAFEPDLVDLDEPRVVHSRANAVLADGLMRNDKRTMRVAVLMYGLGLYDPPDGKPAPVNPTAITDALGGRSPGERREMLEECARYLRSPGSIDTLLEVRLGKDLKIWLDAKVEGNAPLENAALVRAHLDPAGPDVSPILRRLDAEPLVGAERLLGEDEAERRATLDAYAKAFGAADEKNPLPVESRMWMRGQLEGDRVAINCARLRALALEPEEKLSNFDIRGKVSGGSALQTIQIARLYEATFPGADQAAPGRRAGLVSGLRADGISLMYRDLTAAAEPRLDDYRALTPGELTQLLKVASGTMDPAANRRLLELADKLIEAPNGYDMILWTAERAPLTAIANHALLTRLHGGEEALYVAARAGGFHFFEGTTAAIESNVRKANPELADRLQSYAHAGRLWSFGFDARADAHIKGLPKEQQAPVLHAAADASTPELRTWLAANYAHVKSLPGGDNAIYRNVIANPREFVETYGTHGSRELLEIAANHLSPNEIADISKAGHLSPELAGELTRRHERKEPLAKLLLTQDADPSTAKLLADPALAHLTEVYELVTAKRRGGGTDRQSVEEAAMVCRYLYGHGLAPNETNVREARGTIDNARAEIGKVAMFRGRHTVAAFNNEEIANLFGRILAPEVTMFDRTAIRALLEEQTTEKGTLRVFKPTETSRAAMREARDSILDRVRTTPMDKPMTFFFNGHGSADRIWIGNTTDEAKLPSADCSITIRDLADAYVARVRGREGKERPSQPDILFFDCCHSHELARNFYQHLPPDVPKPVIISASEFGQSSYANPLLSHADRTISDLAERAKSRYLHVNDFMQVEGGSHSNPTILAPDLATPARRVIPKAPPGDYLQISDSGETRRDGAVST